MTAMPRAKSGQVTVSRAGNPVVLRPVDTPLGRLIAGACDGGVCLLEYTDPRRLPIQMAALRRRFATAVVDGDHRHLDGLREELSAYFAGRLRTFSVPLDAPGTPFQERVWAELLRIPYGQTRSYEDIARSVGAPNAQRAVGAANGMNRIAIVIPCHRVLNKGGGLGGYGGELWRKQVLLDLERTGQLSLALPR